MKGSLARPLPKAHFLLWAGPIGLQSRGRKEGRGDRWRDSARLKCAQSACQRLGDKSSTHRIGSRSVSLNPEAPGRVGE